MGKIFKEYIDNSDGEVLYVCCVCKAHIVSKKDIKLVAGMELIACYSNPVNTYNICCSRPLTYGASSYAFSDIHCNVCDKQLGWQLQTPESDGNNIVHPCLFLLEESISLFEETE